MVGFLFLSQALGHPVEFAPSAFDLALRLLLLRAIHLRHGYRQPPAGAVHDGQRHV
jgi:hypothetical protein